MTDTGDFKYLNAQQGARVEALRAARSVLVDMAFMKSGKADPMDLYSIATYVITGNDPWASVRAPVYRVEAPDA